MIGRLVQVGRAGVGAWEGEVSRIAEADSGRRSITVFVEVLDRMCGGCRPPGQFRDRFCARREVFNGRGSRFVVPRTAISGGRVMIVNGDGLAERRVSVAYYTEGVRARDASNEREWAVIEDGLAQLASVIISNLDEVHDGELICGGRCA
ncbi:MAG: hypothetical protein R3B46_00985 [Phycisphaerales bacterium]